MRHWRRRAPLAFAEWAPFGCILLAIVAACMWGALWLLVAIAWHLVVP